MDITIIDLNSNELPEEFRRLIEFLQKLQQTNSSNTPHWKECDSCRIKFHNENLPLVIAHMTCDSRGYQFTTPYLDDMRVWLEDQELYEQACSVRDLITILSKLPEDSIKKETIY